MLPYRPFQRHSSCQFLTRRMLLLQSQVNIIPAFQGEKKVPLLARFWVRRC